MDINPTYVSFVQQYNLFKKGFTFEALEENCFIPEPIHQWQAIEWLKNNHGIWVYAKPVLDEDGEWIFKGYVRQMNKFKSKEYQTKLCRESQEACSAAIDYVLEKLI